MGAYSGMRRLRRYSKVNYLWGNINVANDSSEGIFTTEALLAGADGDTESSEKVCAEDQS